MAGRPKPFQHQSEGLLVGMYIAECRCTSTFTKDHDRIASFWGRLFSIVSPLIAAHIYDPPAKINPPLYMAGAVVFICTIAILLMPVKRMGAQSF